MYAIRKSDGVVVLLLNRKFCKGCKFWEANEGILGSLEGAASLAGLIKLVEAGSVNKTDTIVLLNSRVHQEESTNQAQV